MCHYTYDDECLKKHNVSRHEIDEVLAGDTADSDLGFSERGNYRVMFVGFTFEGRLLEVGIEYFEDEREHVFHAMDATRSMQTLFNKRNR